MSNKKQYIDGEGNYYNVYKFKCELYYQKFLKSRSNLFDNNYSVDKIKTIFVRNFYDDNDYKMKFTICIEFYEQITNGKAYSCAKFLSEDIIESI